jgi:hypothetical protein
MIKATAHRLIADCLQWEQMGAWREPYMTAKFIEMSQAMLRVARYVRTGSLG